MSQSFWSVDRSTAEDYWESYHLPRCTRDVVSEKSYETNQRKHKIKYRRVLPDETDRGLPYPFDTTIDTNLMAQFGEGIGVYFMQIIALCFVTLVGIFILIPSMEVYRQNNSGMEYESDFSFLKLSAVCPITKVRALGGCKNSPDLSNNSLCFYSSDAKSMSTILQNQALNYNASCFNSSSTVNYDPNLYSSLSCYSSSETLNISSTLQSFVNQSISISNISLFTSLSCFDDSSILDATCEGNLRSTCELSPTVVALDIALCTFIFLCVLVSKFLEDYYKRRLDEEFVSAKDYSIRVLNPPADAVDPDEWHRFFSRFGEVKYVTISKSNEEVCKLLIRKHTIVHYVNELKERLLIEGQSNPVNPYVTEKNAFFKFVLHFAPENYSEWLRLFGLSESGYLHYLYEVIKEIDEKLKLQYDESFPVNQVFVTFENVLHQNLVMNSFKPPLWNFISECFWKQKTSLLFRNVHKLIIKLPPEPDNIHWLNGSISPTNTLLRKIAIFILSLSFFVLSFYAVTYSKEYSSLLLLFTVSCIDYILPAIYKYLTSLEGHKDEGQFQDAFEAKLFRIRLLTTVVYLYATTDWQLFLTRSWTIRTVLLQVLVCFYDHLLNLIDFSGFLARYFGIGLTRVSHSEFRFKKSVRGWNLAERYTVASKIFFISLFYSFMIPVSFIIALFAFIFVYVSDIYLLLRKSEQPPMIDSRIATRLREQILISIAAHFYVTTRFIFGWPLDNVYFNDATNFYEIVSKVPKYNIFKLAPQVWQSDSQLYWFRVYRRISVAFMALCILVYILGGRKLMRLSFFDWFNYQRPLKINVPFSKATRIFTYFPTVHVNEQVFLFCESDTCPVKVSNNIQQKSHSSQRKQHCFPLVVGNSKEYPDLSQYIPSQYRSYVLSNVKYYDNSRSASDLDIELSARDSDLDSESNSEDRKGGALTKSSDFGRSLRTKRMDKSSEDIIKNAPKPNTQPPAVQKSAATQELYDYLENFRNRNAAESASKTNTARQPRYSALKTSGNKVHSVNN